jgi:membrane-associated PAP2 superfamily phosphatase
MPVGVRWRIVLYFATMSLKPSLPPQGSSRWQFDAMICVLALAALIAWDLSGLDLVLVRMYADASGFALRESWAVKILFHEGGRKLTATMMILLLINIWWPVSFARQLTRRDRVWWFGASLVCLLIAPSLKQLSLTSCPWSLAEFGGKAVYLSHWALGQSDGGPGKCFPSGHAAGAFCFLAGWFILRSTRPHAARWWLGITLVAGVVFGWSQMMRGAHYVSHFLWTAWFCLTLTAIQFHLLSGWRSRSGAAKQKI